MTSVFCLAAVAAEILWKRPICVETNRYVGWPTVCRRANGELLAVVDYQKFLITDIIGNPALSGILDAA